MRTISTHSENSIRFTKKAQFWCEMTNLYRRLYPDHSFRKMAEFYELSETNCRRYYYGIHHYNNHPEFYTQIREGACVDLPIVTL